MTNAYAMTEHAQAERDALCDSVVLFAINTGDMYGTHVAIAQDSANISRWRVWVRYTVCVRYRKEIEWRRFSADMIMTIAQDLKAYYATHIKEMSP